MKTIYHIFKKDSLQQRGGIFFFGLILFMRLINDLQAFQGDGLGPGLFGTLTVYLLIGAVIVLISAVMADPLGNHQAFYRTRPIRMREIVGAKVLFLLAWIVIPITVSETIYLASNSMPLEFILFAVLERVLFITLFCLVMGAGITSFPDAKTAVRTVLLCIPVPFIGAMVWNRLSQSLAISSLSPSSTSPIGLLLLGAFALVIFVSFANYAAKHPIRQVTQVLPFLLVGFSFPLFATSWQSGLGATEVINDDSAQPTEAEIRRANIKVSAFDHGIDPEKVQIQVTTSPNTLYQPGTVVEWNVSEMQLKDSQSKTRSNAFRRPSAHVFYRRLNSSHRGKEIEAIASHLPQNIRLSHGSTGSWSNQPTATGSISITRAPGIIDQPVSLNGSLRGRTFRWELVGEFPLQEDATLSSDQTSWRFLSTRQWRHNNAFDVRLVWKRPALKLSRDQDWKDHGSDILARHEFLLVQETDNIGFTPESSYQTPVVGLLSGCEKSQVTLQYRHTEHHNLKIPKLVPSRAKIMVFEKVFEREIELPWEVSHLRLVNHFQSNHHNNLKPAERLLRHEFVSRLEALGPVPLGKNRAVAGHYLYRVAKLVQARDQWIPPSDPLAQKLAPLAQEHPLMFLDGLRNAHYRPAQMLESCLQQGLTEEQRKIVIERLPKQPQLADLVVARGWIEDARDAFRQLAHEHSRLPISAVQALVLLEEESVYPLLIADFQQNPTLGYYDALHTLPDLESELDRVVRKQWSRRPRVFSHRTNQQELYSIALRHGIREAMTEICQLLTWVPVDDFSYGYGISRAIQENVDLNEIPRNERNDTERVLTWVRQQDPASFQYDPGRRLFFSKKA